MNLKAKFAKNQTMRIDIKVYIIKYVITNKYMYLSTYMFFLKCMYVDTLQKLIIRKGIWLTSLCKLIFSYYTLQMSFNFQVRSSGSVVQEDPCSTIWRAQRCFTIWIMCWWNDVIDRL